MDTTEVQPLHLRLMFNRLNLRAMHMQTKNDVAFYVCVDIAEGHKNFSPENKLCISCQLCALSLHACSRMFHSWSFLQTTLDHRSSAFLPVTKSSSELHFSLGQAIVLVFRVQSFPFFKCSQRSSNLPRESSAKGLKLGLSMVLTD